MSPEEFLAGLGRKHGLEAERAKRLLPLVRQAMDSPPALRLRILRTVEQTVARKMKESREAERLRDRRVLLAVARVLHGWNPGSDILGASASEG